MYSKKTIEELLLTLGMILNAAKEDGLISINPAKSKRLRNPSSKMSVREALTSDEADDIESHLQDIPQLRDRRYVAMLLKFPARCEDIRGLQIKNFNFREQTVSITQGVTYAKGHTIIGDPKTPTGKRKMLILPGLLETLELSQSELNDPEAYVLPSLDDPAYPIIFPSRQTALGACEEVHQRIWKNAPTVSGIHSQPEHTERALMIKLYRRWAVGKTLRP